MFDFYVTLVIFALFLFFRFALQVFWTMMEDERLFYERIRSWRFEVAVSLDYLIGYVRHEIYMALQELEEL